MYKNLIFSKEGSVASIILNRPDTLNALNEQICIEIQDVISKINSDKEVKVLVVSGSGDNFCSGLDLKSFNVQGKKPSGILDEYFHPIVEGFNNLSVPVIAKFSGKAVGAGASILLACDLIYAEDTAEMIFSFVKIGLIPDSGATYFLLNRIGYARAFELCITGKPVSASYAAEIGLINKVLKKEDLAQEIEKITSYLSKAPSVAIAQIKNILRNSNGNNLSEMLSKEAQGQDMAGATEDFKEGLKAFSEKRKPDFKGY